MIVKDNAATIGRSAITMGSNTEKKPCANVLNQYKKLSEEMKSDNFCYRKVRKPITALRTIFWWHQLYFHLLELDKLLSDHLILIREKKVIVL